MLREIGTEQEQAAATLGEPLAIPADHPAVDPVGLSYGTCSPSRALGESVR